MEWPATVSSVHAGLREVRATKAFSVLTTLATVAAWTHAPLAQATWQALA